MDTKRAYDKLADLIDQAIRNRTGEAKDLQQFRESLDVAFYLLGWAQFEYLVRKEAEGIILEKSALRTVDRHAWIYLKTKLKDVSVRNRLDLIFHSDPKARESLDKDYSVRNDAAHDYKKLPKEIKDISAWLGDLEKLVDRFDT